MNTKILWIFLRNITGSVAYSFTEEDGNWINFCIFVAFIIAAIVCIFIRPDILICGCGATIFHKIVDTALICFLCLAFFAFLRYLPAILRPLIDFVFFITNAARDYYRGSINKWKDAEDEYKMLLYKDVEENGKD